MKCASSTDGTEVLKAERSLIRAAMGVVNSDGWAFESRKPEDAVTGKDGGVNIVVFPGSMRRLEAAIARLKQARKEAKPRRRKYT